MNSYLLYRFRVFHASRSGARGWADLASNAGLPQLAGPSLPQSLPLDVLLILVATAAREWNESPAEVMTGFGRSLAPGLIESATMLGEPVGEDDFFTWLEHVVDRLFPRLAATHAGLDLPEIRHATLGPRETALIYRSPRKLCLLLKGILEGCAEYLEEPITWEEPVCMLRGAPLCRVHLHRNEVAKAEREIVNPRQLLAQLREGSDITLYSYYKGIPISYPAILLGADAHGCHFRTAVNLLAALLHEKDVHIALPHGSSGLSGTALQVDIHNETVQVGHLRVSKGKIGLRRSIRVRPQTEVKVTIEMAGMSLEGVLLDISDSGLAAQVPKPYLSEEVQVPIRLQLSLPLKKWSPGVGRGGLEAIDVAIMGEVLGRFDQGEFWTLRVAFSPNEHKMRNMIEQYVMQRQIDVLRELRKIAPG